MAKDISESLIIAVSSRALFDIEDLHSIYMEQGLDAFETAHENMDGVVLKAGPAFSMVKGLLALNEWADPGNPPLVEVIVVSSQHPVTGINIIHSINHWGLPIKRAVFSGGADTMPYLKAFGVDLLLSKSESDVQKSVDQGIAAAHMYDNPEEWNPDESILKIAFDGDSVLFSHESEVIFKTQGIQAFVENEQKLAKHPMLEGPFTKLLVKLCKIQKAVPHKIRMALITARGIQVHERAERTLKSWGVRLDESFFLEGIEKSAFVRAFGAHLFIDDQEVHLLPASKHVPCARVPYPSGVRM